MQYLWIDFLNMSLRDEKPCKCTTLIIIMNFLHSWTDFFRDIADEESWIKEKKLLVGSDDYGRDLNGVQNLKKKHKRMVKEIFNHESTIESIQMSGQTLIEASKYGSEEIVQRLNALAASWNELKEISETR